MVTAIGLRDLQQNASRYVRAVQDGDDEFQVTVHGRDTGVILTRASSSKSGIGVPLGRVGLVPWQTPMSDETKQELLAIVEAGRDSSGFIAE